MMEWLLDLERIRLDADQPVRLQWTAALPAWLLVGIGLLVVAWILVVYRREQTRSARSAVLAGLRIALFALTVAVLCQPVLVLQRNRVERSEVVILMDRSRSMETKEAYPRSVWADELARMVGAEGVPGLADRSRLDLARALLLGDDAALLSRLLATHALRLAFFGGAWESGGLSATDADLPQLVTKMESLDADGSATDIAGAIQATLHRDKARRTAAILLVSDGRETHRGGMANAMDLARDRAVAIFALKIGSTIPRFDIDVGPVRSSQSVFAGDIVTLRSAVTAYGLSEEKTIRMDLVDEATGSVANTTDVLLGPNHPSANAELRVTPPRKGTVTYRIETAVLEGETAVDNNAARTSIEVLQKLLRVLYVEGYPRYEYRYLKNALLREPTIELSVLLLEADPEFVQEGTHPIRRFPETTEELNRYDVVLMGDVDPYAGWLSRAQIRMLLDFVGNHGGGFGLIAGERAAPHRMLGTPLEKLVPVHIDPLFLGRYERTLVHGFRPSLTPEGRHSALFRFSADPETNERLMNHLPELYWIGRTLGPKPGASVFAEHPVLQCAGGPMPLLVGSRYGAGKVLFQATDDTWRWRRGAGELLHDGYWVQVVRWLMPSSSRDARRRYELQTDRRIYPYGTAVRAELELQGPDVMDPNRNRLDILVIADRTSSPNQPSAGNRSDRGRTPRYTERVGDRFALYRLGPGSNRFEGEFVPDEPGDFILQPADIEVENGESTVRIHVQNPDLEAGRIEADHELLERLAAQTGGRMMEPGHIDEVLRGIPDRRVEIPDDITEPLWDTRLVWILFGTLLAAEWVLRKALGLI